ncbi:PspA/IM30 family protein [Amphritea pacifica]|uniref:PspA/IM30 family protein n=1 Tax=Amphritea pacifica TaxID=2811233 RepID=A0ABS2W279_9GAMM|nr:PspA/IM30 family protein [Amphritea pacifica]MBN0985808.1 PspA/IM30 family protein [Amphritea pacifica]MBN1005889.1 PspA/IM30 family protein [Amphritea pacifica]
MNESITSRVGRIISGSLNALVNSIEDSAPEMILEEALREVDSAIDQVRVELGQIAARKHQASTRLMETSGLHEELSSKIQVALAEGREDLAEAGIAHQLDIEAQIPVLEKSISEAGEKEKELDGYIQALAAKKREMKEELQKLLALKNASAIPDHQSAENNGSDVAAKVAKAESAFERIIEKQTAYSNVNKNSAENAAKLAELDELNRTNRIKERLALLKSNSEDSGNV